MSTPKFGYAHLILSGAFTALTTALTFKKLRTFDAPGMDPPTVKDAESSSPPLCLQPTFELRPTRQSRHGSRTFEEITQDMNKSLEAILIVDIHGTMRFVNALASELFGYAEDELVGKPLDILVPQSVRSQHNGWISNFFQSPIRRHMATQQWSPLQIRGVCKDGTELAVDIHLEPSTSLGATGDAFVVALIRNNTGAATAYAELQSICSETVAMETFLRTTNHDFRTALKDVVVSTASLKECKRNLTKSQLECLNVLDAGASKMSAVVTSVLDLSKTESGKTELVKANAEPTIRQD